MNRAVRVRGTLGLALVAGLAACATNPATGESEISLIGEGQEVQMGNEADPQIIASMGLYEDEALQRYVNEVGQRLAAASERPDLPWVFRVIDDPTVNAFAVPGGKIYITRGILAHMNSEAELAGVLGHEIGHVTARHSVSQMSRAQLAQLGLGVGMILAGPQIGALGDLAGAGLQLLFLKYGRDDENEADELGVRYMRRTNYEPTELAEVMLMLERSSQMQESTGRVPEWLSSHPSPPNRVANILAEVRETQAEAAGSGSAIVRRDEFIRRLDNMVFGINPREGFFEGTTFLHPELRFRFDFPSGWQTVNQKQAVQGISENQDAMISITMAEGTPSQAMQEFASDQNVQTAAPRQQNINGLPAVTAEFAVATEQGTLRGLVAFVSHGNNTYQILGYTPESRWGNYSSALSRSIGSFARLTDQAALSAQPERLDVVQVSSGMTLSTFLQRYPSTEEPEIVALINHLDGDARLNGGAVYKRVVGGR
jgi:predicted Zn-dependent protease